METVPKQTVWPRDFYGNLLNDGDVVIQRQPVKANVIGRLTQEDGCWLFTPSHKEIPPVTVETEQDFLNYIRP